MCLQCRYAGYAGGLWVGNLNASGFLWVPAKPVRGFKRLNIFCAQDESIFDLDAKQEYDCGWSQNFGSGSDGVRLEYVEGRVIRDGSKGNGVILRSVNRTGSYEVIRYLYWPANADWFVISAYIRNTGKRAVHFAFWTGEDPWVGTYGTSKGDVGWYAKGIVKKEMSMDGRAFHYGGLIDLGNTLAGQTSTGFSKVADFIEPDPGLPPPDRAFFANSFAHVKADINPERLLNSHTLTAFNLGWTDIRLKPGREVHFSYALGRADTGSPTQPRPPKIPARVWGFDRALSRAYRSKYRVKKAGDRLLPIRFYAESIRMDIGARIDLYASYFFQNITDSTQKTSMFYPFPMDADHPYPDLIEVSTAKWHKVKKGIVWRLKLAPHGRAVVEVHYAQAFKKPVARYILTTTGYWGRPFQTADYEVRVPDGFRNVHVSFKGQSSHKNGLTVYRFTKTIFLPDRDLVVTWSR